MGHALKMVLRKNSMKFLPNVLYEVISVKKREGVWGANVQSCTFLIETDKWIKEIYFYPACRLAHTLVII
jgi:hypothetical protein